MLSYVIKKFVASESVFFMNIKSMFNLIEYDRKNSLLKYLNFILLILFLWVIFVNTSYYIEKIIFGEHENFYDLKLIYNSLNDALEGRNTYKIFPPYFDQPTTSIPPYIINIIKNFGYLEFSSFTKIFIFLEVIAIFFLFFYSYKMFPLKEIKFSYPFIYFYSFNFSLGLAGTIVGNIAVLLYSIVGIALVSLYKEKILIFSILIFIVSCFKFYLLIFFFLPILIYGFKIIKYIVPFLILICFVNLLSYIDNPNLYQSWIELLQIQVSRSPDNPWVGSDITQSFASLINIFGKYFDIYLYPSAVISNLFWSILTITSFLSIFFIYHKKRKLNENERLKILSVGIITIFLFYPRVLSFDLFLVVPVYYFLVKEIQFSNKKNINSLTKFFLFLFFLCVLDFIF